MAPSGIMKRGNKRELGGSPEDADDDTEDLQLNLDTLEELWTAPRIV